MILDTFYSVAQHAVLVHDIRTVNLARPDLARFGLHHDSHEAFAGDLPSPLKAKLNLEGHGAYERLCDQLDDAISTAFQFTIPDKDTEDYETFKLADRTALLLEARALLHDQGAGVQAQLEVSGLSLADLSSDRHVLPALSPSNAERRFLDVHAAAMTAAPAA